MCLREEPAAGLLPVDDATASATGGQGVTVGVSTTDRLGFTSLGLPQAFTYSRDRKVVCLPSRQKIEPTV